MQASKIIENITEGTNAGNIGFVGVVGLGCIGGSIAMALSSAGYFVVGCDVNGDVIKQCLSCGYITKGGTDLEVLNGCSVIFVATPLGIITKVIEDIYSLVGQSAVITDTGSVKEHILKNLPAGIRFVGGHPMAGSEQGGLSAARPFLFKNAYYILTKEGAKDEDYRLIHSLVEQMGAAVLGLDASTHDKVLAKVSHLPHMIAYSLVSSALKNGIEATVAAGGFRDITRIASSDPDLWVNVAKLNKDNLIKEMDEFLQEFVILRQSIMYEKFDYLRRSLEKAKSKRDSVDPHKGFGIYKITMDVKDEPGIIGKITTLLGSYGINLRNIGIEKSRLDGFGALVMEFWNGEDHLRAKEILQNMTAEEKS